ncbi:MAG TPA: phosphoribosylformylglycinamidine cyclo-ligase, partial [Dehalococcoidia bacterium]|nr:phosphoribosylformylglycinamidine cyclo-ligase [Dehalococcoidia bacterium]
MTDNEPATYAAAGVDIDAAEALVSRYARMAKAARRPEVLADVGPFAGLFRLGQYRDPVLVASTDSVGTKVKLAALAGRYEGTGHDLVNHCVNDTLTSGAHPLFFLDYIGNSGLTDNAKAALVKGCVDACAAVGAALLGGETADMPGTYREGDFDLVGFVLGVVERDAVIDGSAIREGDVLIGLPSDGLHTNGYSLVRRIFQIGLDEDASAERSRLDHHYPELGETLADALLRPHRCYYNDLKPLLQP